MVRFDEMGAIVDDVSFPEDYNTIDIFGIPRGTTADDVHALIYFLLGDSTLGKPVTICLAVDKTSGHLIGSATMRDPDFGAKLRDRLEEYGFEDMSVIPALKPELFVIGNHPIQATKVHCSWPKTSTSVSLYFQTRAKALSAITLINGGELTVLGRRISCAETAVRIEVNASQVWSVALYSVPIEAEQVDISAALPARLRADAMGIRPVNDDCHDRIQMREFINGHLRSVNGGITTIRDWEDLDVNDKPRLMTAAHFDTETEARVAASQLDGVETSQGLLEAKLMYTARLSTSDAIWQLVQDEVWECFLKYEDVCFETEEEHDAAEQVSAIVEGLDRAQVAEATCDLELLFKGDLLLDGSGIVWHPDMGIEGEAMEEMRAIESTYDVAIHLDKKERQVHVFGLPAQRADAQTRLLDLVARLCMPSEANREEAVEEQERKLEICPVCGIVPDLPVLAHCGHVYCSPCLASVCLSARSSEAEGVFCMGGMEQDCLRPIHVSIMAAVLTPTDVELTLEALFNSYLKHHADLYEQCPTPWCNHVLRRSTATSEDIHDGLAPQRKCGGCLVVVCTACCANHDRMSCARYRRIQGELGADVDSQGPESQVAEHENN
jgi:hypothetical protein